MRPLVVGAFVGRGGLGLNGTGDVEREPALEVGTEAENIFLEDAY